ncbi:MAG: hypothetical protein R3B07_00770 [Polyangiaceae bacterium]
MGWRLCVAAGVVALKALVGCGPPAACEAPGGARTSAEAPDMPRVAPPSAPEAQPDVSEPAAVHTGEPQSDAGLPPPSQIPGWPLEISIPQGSKSGITGDEFEISISWKVSVRVRRFSERAPVDSAGLAAYWDRQDFGDQRHILRAGAYARLPFTVRSYRVRLGERHGDTMVHYFERVTRVYALLAIDSGSHALCTGYLEYDAEPADEAVGKVVAVCESLRSVAP